MSVEKTDANTNSGSNRLAENELDLMVGGANDLTRLPSFDCAQSPNKPHQSASEVNAYGYKSIGNQIQQELKDAGLW